MCMLLHFLIGCNGHVTLFHVYSIMIYLYTLEMITTTNLVTICHHTKLFLFLCDENC